MDSVNIKDFFKRDRFAAGCGIELTEVSRGRAVAVMAVTPDHLNGVSTVQGGAIFTLADLAFAAAANSHGTVAVAVNVSISFLKGISAGRLTATAEEVSFHPKLATYSVRVKDDDGDLVATFEGMVYRKKETLASLVRG